MCSFKPTKYLKSLEKRMVKLRDDVRAAGFFNFEKNTKKRNECNEFLQFMSHLNRMFRHEMPQLAKAILPKEYKSKSVQRTHECTYTKKVTGCFRINSYKELNLKNLFKMACDSKYGDAHHIRFI